MGNCSCTFTPDSTTGIIIPFEVEELNAYMNAFSRRKFVGKGAFGSVYHGVIHGRKERNINGRQIAVKIFRNKEGTSRTHWQSEKEYLPKLLHQNIIELIGHCETAERFYLVYPFMQNGTVSSKLAGLDWSKTLKIIKGVASAIQMLHGQEPALLHRDLRLNNVLLDEHFTPKLADFGMVAPEEKHLQSGSRAGDMYSLGVMILQLIMKEENASLAGVGLPWHISHWANRIHSQQGHVVNLALTTTGCSKRAAIAITKLGLDCVMAKPFERPSIDEVILKLANLQGIKLK